MTPEVRYELAMHRMQSAVAFDFAQQLGLAGLGGPAGDAIVRALKHIRVGLNSVMSSQKALADVLIEKGLITAEEYTEQVLIEAEREADARVAEVIKKYDLPAGVNFG